jgi:predicted metalloprotease with PDZ domain
MRNVFRHHGGQQPYRDSDIETAVADACGCPEAHAFFQENVNDGKPIDFAAYLALLGLRLQHDQPTATDPQGHPLPDTRVYSWILRDDTSLRIGISNPNGCWAKAGLHTGDILIDINGRPMHTRQDFQTAMRAIHIGDTVMVRTKKETGTIAVPVYMDGYTTPLITITEDAAANSRQQRLFHQWASSAAPSSQ